MSVNVLFQFPVQFIKCKSSVLGSSKVSCSMVCCPLDSLWLSSRHCRIYSTSKIDDPFRSLIGFVNCFSLSLSPTF